MKRLMKRYTLSAWVIGISTAFAIFGAGKILGEPQGLKNHILHYCLVGLLVTPIIILTEKIQ
jgi:hypothetical protein